MAAAKPRARVATSLPSVEVEVLRQIGDTIAAIGRTLETLSADVKDVQQQVAFIKGQEYKTGIERNSVAIEKLDNRIDLLETARNKVVGATQFFGWVTEHAPWLLAVGAIAAAYWTKH